MTPKEKAEELVSKFRFSYYTDQYGSISVIHITEAKKCALICLKTELDAKIDAFRSMEEFQIDIASQGIIFAKKEYREVKQEIEKL
jgi:hypothetical protein